MSALARRVLVAGAVVATLVTVAPAAFPCGNAWMREDPVVVRLREADAALENDDVARARERGREVLADARSNVYQQRRARRLVALGVARRDGATAGELDEAAAVLRELRTSAPDDVTLEVDLGEVLLRTRTPRGIAEGRALLEPLEKRDLVGSRHAVTELAVVRALEAATRADGPVASVPADAGRPPRPFAPALALGGSALLGSVLLRRRR